uniref:Uncharacterized protein n=1 Tax=Anguilla anguilla TaxID=7936 RepID=A0A0E9VHB9_ANGAN
MGKRRLCMLWTSTTRGR